MQQELVNYIETQILPQYENFDSAHRKDHILTVINQSLSLARHYPVDQDMVYTIAAFHDLGVSRGRELHHIYSGEILLADTHLPLWFSPSQLQTMREAVEDHRASAGREPRSIYGRIVAEADRDIRPMVILRRIVEFGLEHYPEKSKEEHFRRFMEHLKEKYGPDGYLKCFLPESPNAARLQELREMMCNRELMLSVFEKNFSEGIRQLPDSQTPHL